jgi:hypothetical protein
VEVVDAELDEVSESKKAFEDSFSCLDASKALNRSCKNYLKITHVLLTKMKTLLTLDYENIIIVKTRLPFKMNI